SLRAIGFVIFQVILTSNRTIMGNLILTLLLLSFCSAVHAQQNGTSKAETFDMEWEGQQVTMQKYFIIFLKKVPTEISPKKRQNKYRKSTWPISEGSTKRYSQYQPPDW